MRCAVAAFALVAALAAQSARVARGAAEFRSVAEDAAVLYDAPSAQSKKLFIVNQGYPLEVDRGGEGWVKVRDASGALSWVEAARFQPNNAP